MNSRKELLLPVCSKESIFSNPQQAGYSLIELAIVLTIMGIIGGLTLPLLTRYREKENQETVYQQHDKLMRCLASYVLKNASLPYAADPDASPETFGHAEKGRNAGILPFKDMGLDERMVKDAHNNYISYVVDTLLCGAYETLTCVNMPPSIKQPSSSPLPKVPAQVGGTLGHQSRGGIEGFKGTIEGNATAQKSYCGVQRPGNNPHTHLEIDDGKGSSPAPKAVLLISHGPGGYGALTYGSKNFSPHKEGGPSENHNARALRERGRLYKKQRYSLIPGQTFRHYLTSIDRYNLLAYYTSQTCYTFSDDSKK